MITQEQIDLAKSNLDQARETAKYAHQAYADVAQSGKVLKNAFINAGNAIPKDIAGTFEKLIEDNTQKYKIAHDYFVKLEDEYKSLLLQFEKMSP